jgi:transposase
MLEELAGIALSPGTLYNAIETAAERLQAPVGAIGEALLAAPIAHADETGMRVGGNLQWLHVLSSASLTAYFAHPKRGAEALEAFGLLSRFQGVLVHDHWRAYRRFECLHAFCNAHHLRELIAIAETIPSQRPWAEDLIALLGEANTLATEARAGGLAALPEPMVRNIQTRFDAIIQVAKARNPAREPPPGTRKRVRQSPAHNLVKRLSENREGVLRFVTDLRVPFDNNLAERDVRMPKLKQKVSGCFRSDQGVAHFATIRSYLSTLRKQSADIFNALILTFQGSPPMPRLAPE